VNDSPAAYASKGRAAFEGLLRLLLALPSRPALLLLHHYPWWKAEGDGAAAGLFYREPEGQLTLYSHVRVWERAGGGLDVSVTKARATAVSAALTRPLGAHPYPLAAPLHTPTFAAPPPPSTTTSPRSPCARRRGG
jgi:hypothetical protein